MQNADPADLQTTIAHLRNRFSAEFDKTYIEHVIIPSFLATTFQGERLFLPMIDVQFSKENALPHHLLGLLYEDWKVSPEEGITVFLQGLEKRGPDNRRKRIVMSAFTPDLYGPMYRDKVEQFFDTILHASHAGKPVMGRYLENYFDLLWDLHLGVKGDAIPADVREFAQSFHAVLAHQDPTRQIVYDSYMSVRSRLAAVKQWIGDRIGDLVDGKTPRPEKTFAFWWMRNSGEGEDFTRNDAVVEILHDFMAISQWGNMIYEIMLRLAAASGDPEIRAWFKKTMESDSDHALAETFAPLTRFVMELFRTISPNHGSLSVLEATGSRSDQTFNSIVIPHAATSSYPVHWQRSESFDPDRFKKAPASHQIDEEKCAQMGFAKCPFDRTAFKVRDGRNVALHNSGFGAVYPVVDGKPSPVCDHAGFAPFGFGYRRCPAEQFTIQVFEDFLRKVWSSGIEFKKLDIAKPQVLPIGPGMVVGDDVGFMSAT
jgi:cytochrome P450